MVQNPSFKIFTVAALGAFIGSLVGLQLNHLFWWVGMLVGGGVGYLAYNLGEVIRAIPLAVEQARIAWRRLVNIDYLEGPREFGREVLDFLRFIAKAAPVVVPVVLATTVVGMVWVMEILVTLAKHLPTTPWHAFFGTRGDAIATFVVSLITGLMVCGTMFFALPVVREWQPDELEGYMRQHKGRIALTMLYKATPLGLVTWLPAQAPVVDAEALPRRCARGRHVLVESLQAHPLGSAPAVRRRLGDRGSCGHLRPQSSARRIGRRCGRGAELRARLQALAEARAHRVIVAHATCLPRESNCPSRAGG